LTGLIDLNKNGDENKIETYNNKKDKTENDRSVGKTAYHAMLLLPVSLEKNTTKKIRRTD
jgi:hypothetical protein